MPGGINISQVIGAAISAEEVAEIVTGQNPAQPVQAPPTPQIWRPPQWNKPATYMLSVQGNELTTDSTPQLLSDTSGVPTLRSTVVATTLYVFDAVMRARHSSQLQITEHPVQQGPNISDHAFRLPRRIGLEIKMSDAMDMYQTGMWTGNTSKSVSAYQTLLRIQENRLFMTLTTRLFTYQNLMIESIDPEETKESIAGLCCLITFKEVITATVANQIISARPQSTDTTQLATKQAQPVPAAVTQQYSIKPPTDPVVEGSGFWSSLSTAFQEILN